MSSYLSEYIGAAGKSLPLIESVKSMGWTDDDSGRFVVGNRMYMPDGSSVEAPIAACAEQEAAPMVVVGDPQIWRRAFDLSTGPGSEKYLYAAAQAFAAPLAQATEAAGFIVNLYGETGGGKTSIQKIIAAVWGRPGDLQISQMGSETGATLNTYMSRLATYKNLPVVLDETTRMPDEKVSNFIYSAASGVERQRMKSDTSLQPRRFWKTSIVTSTNVPIWDKLEAAYPNFDAEMMRLFDVPMPGGQGAANPEIAELVLQLNNNCGHAGARYASVLTRNRDAIFERVRERVKQLTALYQARQNERFWIANAACSEVGLEVAAAAGIISFGRDDRVRLREWVLGQIQSQRMAIRSHSTVGTSMLGDLLADLLPETLVVRQARTSDKGGQEQVLLTPKSALSVRVELSTRTACVSYSRASAWCHRNRLTLRALIENIRKAKLFADGKDPENVRTKLGRGVPEFEGTGTQRCFRVKFDTALDVLGEAGVNVQ